MANIKQSPLSIKLERIAILKDQIDKLNPLKVELEQLKFEVMLDMQQAGSKRTEAYSGYYAIRASRTNIAIADPEAIKKWLTTNKFKLAEYTKLDEARIKALAESKLKEDGEIIPGLESNETEYLTLKKETK